MTENTYQFAARQAPRLEAEKADLLARLEAIEAELKILRPALKAAPTATETPAEEKPARRKAAGAGATILDLHAQAPGQDDIIAARIGVASAEGSGE